MTEAEKKAELAKEKRLLTLLDRQTQLRNLVDSLNTELSLIEGEIKELSAKKEAKQ